MWGENMARRKKKNPFIIFMYIVLFVLIGILVYKIYDNNTNIDKDKNKKDNNEVIQNNNKKENTKEENKVENVDDKKEETNEESTEEKKVNSNSVTEKSNTNENTEIINENQRRGGNITIELIGEENVTVSVGSEYKDAGFKAIYSDGSDASDKVDVDNAVDTSKEGIYTVTYYAGNSTVIRRVTVE